MLSASRDMGPCISWHGLKQQLLWENGARPKHMLSCNIGWTRHTFESMQHKWLSRDSMEAGKVLSLPVGPLALSASVKLRCHHT